MSPSRPLLARPMNAPTRVPSARVVLQFACLIVIVTYALMMDLKGISTDEGVRLAVINGGQPFTIHQPAAYATWDQVMEANWLLAYQPLYYLLLNSLMRIVHTQDVDFFRAINLAFLWLSLQGLLILSREWRLVPRLFLIGLFSFNAYLFMHVLQIREYIAGVAFYIWSTLLVLQLERRELRRPWGDIAWFATYGLLLTAGFYLQSWVVFPAIGQSVFLLLRRQTQRLRFYAHLALSYLIVLTLSWPYLETHQQKIKVGLWASENHSLWSHLANGFSLVLSGHLAGHSLFTGFLCVFWLAAMLAAGLLFFSRTRPVPGIRPAGEYRREGMLIALCIAIPLAFQIGYFYQVENLSVWPRYFIIHYFFATWLIALVFRRLDEIRTAGASPARSRHLARIAGGVMLLVLTVSGCYQVRSYYRDPLLDTGTTPVSNWPNVSAEVARVIRPGDVVVTSDFILRSTLTFTRPLPNPVLLQRELETSDLRAAERMVYLEALGFRPEREALAARMQKLGFPAWQEIELHTPDGKIAIPDWRLVIFRRASTPAG